MGFGLYVGDRGALAVSEGWDRMEFGFYVRTTLLCECVGTYVCVEARTAVGVQTGLEKSRAAAVV